MTTLVLFNKPYQVLSQFTDKKGRKTLADFIDMDAVYPAGRLDYDSEGLLLLTGSGQLQHQISHPQRKIPKTYWVQVEGRVSDDAVKALAQGLQLNDGITRPAKVKTMPAPKIWDRKPPIRHRQRIATEWLSITLTEGRNRQVRRMTAAVGLPTLRLIRAGIGHWTLGQLAPGAFTTQSIHLPKA
ncbi:MAG: pseudouridine synthase [Pseudomonadota bacterium]